MSPGDAGGAPAGEGSAPSPSSRPSANNDDAVSSVAPDGTIDPMVAEAEQSALTLLRRELAASRRATERERLVAKRACEQLAAERAASAEREEELMTLEARLEALTEGRESAREEAFRREASPSSSPPDDDDDDDARRATSPPAAAELFKTPHAAADDEEEEEEEDGEVFVASGVPPSRGRGTLDPRAVAAAEALLARADALEHEHAREIAALNARVRALERALSSAEGAAAVAEAAAAEALRQQSRMATHQTAAALRRREREEAEAEATMRELKRRLERERERADAWKARAIAAESKAAKATAEAQLCADRAAAQLRADSAQTSQTSRVTFEEKVASSASFAADGGSELAKGPFSRKLANGRRVRVGSPSSTTPGDAGRMRLGSLGRSTAAPSARLAIALAARGGKGGRLDVSESRDAFRASLRRQGEALARLAAGRVARRAEMAALRDAVDAMGVT